MTQLVPSDLSYLTDVSLGPWREGARPHHVAIPFWSANNAFERQQIRRRTLCVPVRF